MNLPDFEPLRIAIALTATMLSAGVVLAVFRLLRGPSLPDRVVALDLIGILVVGILALAGIAAGQPVLLDAAVVLALMGFLGTVAFARYVEWSADDQ